MARRESKGNSSNASGIFAEEPSDREESTSLKLALILLLLSFLFELILMFVRHHFLNCLAYIFVFGIYFLNYFDRIYVKVCLYLLLGSELLDFIWLIVMAGVTVTINSPSGITTEDIDLPLGQASLNSFT
jgi:hypothetical protein